GDGTTATVATSTPNGFKAGDLVVISGAIPAAFNGTYVITSTVDPFTFTFASSVNATATGAISTYRYVNGDVVAPLVSSLSGDGTTATVRTATANGFVVGDVVAI